MADEGDTLEELARVIGVGADEISGMGAALAAMAVGELAAKVDELEAENARLAQAASEFIEEIALQTHTELKTLPTRDNVNMAKRAISWLARERDALVDTLDRERQATDLEVAAEWKAARAAASAAGFDMAEAKLSDVIAVLSMERVTQPLLLN